MPSGEGPGGKAETRWEVLLAMQEEEEEVRARLRAAAGILGEGDGLAGH